MNGFRLGLLTLLTIAALTLGQATLSADTITDPGLGVSYTATSTLVPVADNTYDVFLKVDATGFSAGTGFLTAVSLQFKTGSDTSSSVSLVTAPGGAGSWSGEMPGGLDASGCNGNGANSGAVCFQYTNVANTTNTAVPGGPFNFEFAVTMPGSDVPDTLSHVKAAYNAAVDNSGKNLGLTSMDITIQPGAPTTVPEPATLALMSGGLVAFAAIRRSSRKLRL